MATKKQFERMKSSKVSFVNTSFETASPFFSKILYLSNFLSPYIHTQSNQTSHEVVLLHPNATDRHVRTLFCA